MKQITIDQDQLSYLDQGTGTPVVFVHGTPSSSREFAETISMLQSEFRCLALDHLGFGQSAKPFNGDYSLKSHSDRFQFWLNQTRPGPFHLIVHDFGGPIAFPAILDDPAQILSLTLINTWGWPLEETEPAIKKQRWLMTSKLMKFLYLKWNFSARMLVKMAWGQHRPLTKEKHRLYLSAFPKEKDRHGTVEFLNALFDSNLPAWKNSEKLSREFKKPVLFIWGNSDRLISPANLRRWQSLFPNAQTEILPKVGHFVCDEAPELVAPLLRRFLQRVTS